MYPCELHGVFWSAGRWGQELILQKETFPESQTATGDGWTRGRWAEGGREGEKGEVRGSGLTGSRNMNGRLPLLQKQQLQAE